MLSLSVPIESLAYLRDKVVCITGAAGSVGAALVEQCIQAGVRAVRAIDHGESELFYVFERHRDSGRIVPMLGDIRELERLRLAFTGADIVIHAAALKHVELGEFNPFEIVNTNLNGLNNVIRASLDCNVDRVIFTSSDKAVHSTSVMGASKMMGERLMTAANEIRGPRRTRFSSVRFGNVLGSRGSVVPLFARAALRGEPLRLTDPNMTRYVMTLGEAARLVIEAGNLMQSGEVFVTKMHAIKIADLAEAIRDEVSGPVRSEILHTRPRPGEKLYEELLSKDELGRALETERMIIIPPQWEGSVAGYSSPTSYPNATLVKRAWCSADDTYLEREQLRRYLREQRVLAEWTPVAPEQRSAR